MERFPTRDRFTYIWRIRARNVFPAQIGCATNVNGLRDQMAGNTSTRPVRIHKGPRKLSPHLHELYRPWTVVADFKT